MQLIVEVITGDDLFLDALNRGDIITITTDNYVTDKVTVHSVAYIPEEALE